MTYSHYHGYSLSFYLCNMYIVDDSDKALFYIVSIYLYTIPSAAQEERLNVENRRLTLKTQHTTSFK